MYLNLDYGTDRFWMRTDSLILLKRLRVIILQDAVMFIKEGYSHLVYHAHPSFTCAQNL
jgi:hypothetical protein